jgi:VIT1/CCC1 family predicted Fe2+/Mn2+ transporter
MIGPQRLMLTDPTGGIGMEVIYPCCGGIDVHDELGVVEDTQINPWLEGVQIGLSFVVGGLIPTLPVLFSLPQARWWAYGLTAITALALGALKARYTHQSPVWASLEFLVVLTLGTLAGAGLGLLLHAG